MTTPIGIVNQFEIYASSTARPQSVYQRSIGAPLTYAAGLRFLTTRTIAMMSDVGTILAQGPDGEMLSANLRDASERRFFFDSIVDFAATHGIA